MYRANDTTYRIRNSSSSESMGISNTRRSHSKQYRSCNGSISRNISNNLYQQQWMQYHSNSNSKSESDDHGNTYCMYRTNDTTYRIRHTGRGESMGVCNAGSGNCQQHRISNRSISRNISNNLYQQQGLQYHTTTN